MSTNITGRQIKDGTIKNADVASDAAIALSKLDSTVASKTYVDTSVASVTPPPTGVMTMFAGSSAPVGWVMCDGSAISRSTYSALFTVIGTTWGAGDGSTTFNVPDMRCRSPIGAGTKSGLTTRALATNYGVDDSALTGAHVPVHIHPIGGNTGNQTVDHTHGVGSLVAATESAHTHGTTNASNFIVSSSSGLGAGATAAAGTGAATWGQTTATAAGSAHTHSLSGTTATNSPSTTHAHSLPANTGNNTSGSATILHPVAAINFIIKT